MVRRYGHWIRVAAKQAFDHSRNSADQFGAGVAGGMHGPGGDTLAQRTMLLCEFAGRDLARLGAAQARITRLQKEGSRDDLPQHVTH
jgi:hypothetical protein